MSLDTDTTPTQNPASAAAAAKTSEPQPRFGRLLFVCALAVAFCGWLVWFASTYMRDCCGP